MAEAPPAALDRYFYFENVLVQDGLFGHVARAALDLEPSREYIDDYNRAHTELSNCARLGPRHG